MNKTARYCRGQEESYQYDNTIGTQRKWSKMNVADKMGETETIWNQSPSCGPVPVYIEFEVEPQT